LGSLKKHAVLSKKFYQDFFLSILFPSPFNFSQSKPKPLAHWDIIFGCPRMEDFGTLTEREFYTDWVR